MKWNHIGIKTADMEKSLNFYCGLLGLRQLEVVDILGKKFYFVGNDDFSIEIEEGNPTDTQAAMGSSTGIYHMSFTVEDIRGLVRKLRDSGVLVIFDPLQPRPDRWTSFIQGPDGEFIQLIEYV
ncbi:MAG TPA: VOC family protein [Spirochaetes bacterium]|nr:VOC family protein [Spirochaetota bacterium]